jgi:uncharacterized protein (DUF608 family)
MNPTPLNQDNDCFPSGMDRRTFVRVIALGAAASLAATGRVMAGAAETPGFESLVPADKKLSKEWLDSLTARGEPEIYRGEELKWVGMPVGGLCAGLIYLGGDGKPWLWDIFNRDTTGKQVTYAGRTFGNRDGSTYVEPMVPRSPFAHGFALKYQAGPVSGRRTLDKAGNWEEITFQGSYPLATVNYRDPGVPVTVKLEAFSPFIPLNFDDSSLPATVLRYTVANPGNVPAELELAGWMENAVLAMSAPSDSVVRKNEPIKDASGQGLLLTGLIPENKSPPLSQPDILFADFSDGTYKGWTAEGEAFGSAPVARKDLPGYMSDIGGNGGYIVTSHNFRAAPSIEAADNLTGTLTSAEFTIERDFITFYSSGGHRPHEAGVRLMVDGRAVFEQTGNNNNRLKLRIWDVAKYRGKKARIVIFDQAKGPWGSVHANNFVFTDKGVASDKRNDAGTMALYLMDAGAGISSIASLAADRPEESVFNSGEAALTVERPIAAVKKSFTLAPGASTTLTFILSWHFANIDPVINGPDTIHSYAARFPDAGAVAGYIALHFSRLSGDTMAWVDTWNDSTLPHWFLHRTFSNTCNLATTTSYRFSTGQFWAWEGIYSCEGTCTHVWGYAQAMGRIFPELERALRIKTDYAFAFDPHTGTIQYRGTHGGFAADGQAGIILRTYREHLMSADDSFLKPLWPRVRLAMDRLVQQVNDKGLLDGPQHNTLDTAWYGEVAWISGLYLAALRAAEEMAMVTEDTGYAAKCRQLFDKGSQSLAPELFNGQYFMDKVDPNHLDAINSGTGCEIDQVMGQSWAWQVGLGRIFPQAETVSALQSLWRYNFAPDAGRYHEMMNVGRWYAMPGEAGLLVCTFPRPDWDFKKASGKGPAWAALYFNECQSGYEHEVASHMIAEGLVREGLAVLRAIHDRYAPSKRNPYNEIECGDHYSRAMASYGSFITMCGFEFDGPKGRIGFAPRLTPENFKAAFTSAEGWGSFSQKMAGGGFNFSLDLKWGKLRVHRMSLAAPQKAQPASASVSVNGRRANALIVREGNHLVITLSDPAELTAGGKIEVALS